MRNLHLALSALAFVFLTACAGSECDDAVSKLVNDCGFHGGAELPGGGGAVECNDHFACIASCVNRNSCDSVAKNDMSFSTCVGKCPPLK